MMKRMETLPRNKSKIWKWQDCVVIFGISRLDEGDDVQITDEKSAEQVSAEELKAKKAAAEAADDGVVCLE